MTTNEFTKSDFGNTANINGILIRIRQEINDNNVTYANRMLNLYLSKRQEIIEYILNEGVRSFYQDRFSDREIAKKLNDANIEIINDNWGLLVWLNSDLDEHIIQVEFDNDMELSYVSIDG